MTDLNTNNSKKLIIGISIVFCTIILIIGVSFAYFSQSDTKEIGNLVTENINGTLHYDDNNDYMFGNLIPVNEEDVLKFASKDNDICKYQEGMYACNLYEFTITNNSNVAQELMITLKPTFNEFGNLYYILLDKNKDDISLDNVPVSKGHINETNSIEIANKVVLGSGSSKTYTIVYYVKNLEDINQTEQDAGKQFYAKVRVDSITTGTYAGTLMESKCYEYEEITEGKYAGTYKLVSFNGIDEFGVADTTCGVTRNGDFYSVTVPSKIKDENNEEIEISTLGNTLFIGLDLIDGSMTPKSYINNIIIEDEIEVIEDGKKLDNYSATGAFAFMGYDLSSGAIEDYVLTIKLPSNLKYLGYGSFGVTPIDSLRIPPKVETINKIFGESEISLKNLTFEGALEGTSLLTTIGEDAFVGSEIESLVIPASVKTIGDRAFYSGDIKLKSLTFVGADNNKSNLETIGEDAFYGHALETDSENPLILPSSITTIGNNAFRTNSDGLGFLKNILFMGSRENLDKLGTSWYNNGYTTVKAYEE